MTKTAKVLINQGIHMRPAGEIMKVALMTTKDVTIQHKGTVANAKSVMSLILLSAVPDSTVEVSSEDAEIVNRIVKIIETKDL